MIFYFRMVVSFFVRLMKNAIFFFYLSFIFYLSFTSFIFFISCVCLSYVNLIEIYLFIISHLTNVSTFYMIFLLFIIIFLYNLVFSDRSLFFQFLFLVEVALRLNYLNRDQFNLDWVWITQENGSTFKLDELGDVII